MENKNLKKGLAVILLLANFLLVPVAQADLDCSSLNMTSESGEANPSYKDTKNYVVTIIEESIGSTTTSTGDTNFILDCFRKTECKLDKDGKQKCASFYVNPGNCTPGKDTTCQRVQAYIATSGAGLLYTYIAQIYRWAAVVIGSVSVLFMVVGGVQIATAGDNSENINKAKERIIQSIAGLVLLFMSAAILYTINPNFFTLT